MLGEALVPLLGFGVRLEQDCSAWCRVCCLPIWLAGTSDPERACVMAQGRCTFASPTCSVLGQFQSVGQFTLIYVVDLLVSGPGGTLLPGPPLGGMFRGMFRSGGMGAVAFYLWAVP